LKGAAFIWVFFNHVVERVIGGAYADNPTVPWPPLAARLAQFAPVRGGGVFAWPLTFLRDLAWYGDVGVTLFVIASGFGLTYGLLARSEPEALNTGRFYRRRVLRIFPLWWGAHLVFLPLGIIAGTLSTGDWRFYADLPALRFLPGMFYYFSPAWWYVGLIVQLYLVFPLLWRVMRRFGPAALVAAGCGVGFIALAAGPFLFHDGYLDAWQRGAFFVTRLPEFVVGIALGNIYFRQPERVSTVLRSPLALLAGVAAIAAGFALSFTLTGMIVAPLLLGAGAFAVVFRFVPDAMPGSRPLGSIGRMSYPLYLTHHPFVLLFVPGVFSVARVSIGTAAAICATFVYAVFLERVTSWTERALAALAARRGAIAAAAAVVGAASFIVLVPLVLDVAVERFDPQEIYGWGERASLEPDDRFGWKMIPSQTTRLRWESYDYRVTSNALGFPAPAFAERKAPHALRILVTGDAFSSAEGVDTADAWPRLLQSDLSRPGRPVEVLNFSITGYGPNEEAAVVRAFVPRFHPDIVLIENFANDVQDVLTSDDTFRESIGFENPPQTGIRATLKLAQLRAWLRLRVVAPLAAVLRQRPDYEGYFLGNFVFLERGRADFDTDGVRETAARYEQIRAVAAAAGARTIVAFVPPPASVCDARALRYYPHHVDLHDAARYDLSLPQRRVEAIAKASGVTLWDLAPQLEALTTCPYMPRNMHFTPAGQSEVAEMLARKIEALK
jgi:peptidoglycan/LPS O-acetylase OafA/YrhL/lysophospholipase L1-like esterase